VSKAAKRIGMQETALPDYLRASEKAVILV